ncbi:uncharacterized protein LOC131927666 isoform X1 [Physella acuta]|uniref:uncharacterized protein LOC131927666 isoform X1 n=1 Tax=Physella acuta TaxID=109671 RepID=UPI0027DE65D4|nr:uncharacterized protein LOC131927666 isoform X1 [Physella acuta]
MEIALVLLMFFTFNIDLSGAVNRRPTFEPKTYDLTKPKPCNAPRKGNLSRYPRFEPTIHGWEKVCEASNCRYTGRITGSIKAFGFERPQPQTCVFYLVQYDYGIFWPGICSFYLYPCDDNCNTPSDRCNCTGDNEHDTISVKFYPIRGSKYRLAVWGGLHTIGYFNDTDPDWEDQLYQCSNVFDTTIKPDDWNPINSLTFGYSTNGYNQGTNIIGIVVVLLIKIIFND